MMERRARSDAATQARIDGFMYSKDGVKMAETAQRQNNDLTQMNADMQEFLAYNDKAETGGIAGRYANGVASWASPDFQKMNTITNKWGPLMRQLGSGAMSDKDMEIYLSSIPNTKVDRSTNVANAQRIMRANQRIMDFNQSKLEAYATGNAGNFARDWGGYVQETSIYKGDYISYSEWTKIRKGS